MPKRKPKLSEKERKELERLQQKEAEKELLLEKERVRTKHIKDEREHAMRKLMLDLTLKHFEKIKQEMESVRKCEKEERMWEKYLDPEVTPGPDNPAELRSYLHQWELNDANQSKYRIDPCLFLNERSFLSQDVSKKDTRLKRFQEFRKPIGDTFLPKIKQCLIINNEMNDFLIESDPNLSDRIYNDLKTLQVIFRKELVSYLNKWSFEVLSDIDRDMKLLDPITAEYNYDSDVVKHFLWTFREVPLPPNYTQVNLVSMTSCKSEFTKSNMMDLAELCLRGLFLKYDHLSDFASTYKIVSELKPEIHDLKTELQNEQKLLMELKSKKLDAMKEIRRLFDEEKKHLAEEESLVEKASKKGAKPSKPVEQKEQNTKKKKRQAIQKIIQNEEPPIVDEDTIVDVSEELVSMLKDNFMNKNANLNPIYLNLESNEINLREITVLGGIYCFNLVERPRQSRKMGENFLITLIDQPDKLRYSDFLYNYIESPKPHLSLMHVKDTRRNSIFPKQLDIHEKIDKRRSTLYIQERRTTALLKDFEEEEKRWVSENEINQKKLFELRIQVPDGVFWWEPPSVCRWEPWEESEAFKDLSPAMQNFNLNHEKVLEERQQKLFTAQPLKRDFKTIKRLQDTKLSEVKTSLQSHYLIKDYLMPRMIDDYKFVDEIRDDVEKDKKEKENRLKLRKEAIEREKQRLANEMENEKAKKVNRESRLISFAEPEIVPKFAEAETQTDFLIEVLPIKRISELRETTRKNSETDRILTLYGRKSVGTQTGAPSSRTFSPRTSKTSSDAFNEVSSTLSISRETERIPSPISLKLQVDDEKKIELSDEGSPLIIQARSSFIPSFVQVTPENTPPKFLFNIKKRLKPLEVIKGMDEDQSDSLLSIQLEDIKSLNADYFDEDQTTLSNFLVYLEGLQEKEKPFFHSDSYIDRILEKLETKKAEDQAEATTKKLKELKHQLRISKMLEAKKRESIFYRIPRKSVAEVSKSRVWDVIPREPKKRIKSKSRRTLTISIKNESMTIESKAGKPSVRLMKPSLESSFEDEHLELLPHFLGKWTKKHIHCENFDSNSNTITFKAGLFGNFGLFTPKYVNFPYKHWKIIPNMAEQEVFITLGVKYTTVEFLVTSKGFKVGIYLKTKSFLTELVPIISEFVTFKKLQEKMRSMNVNVFPEADACCYIQNISEKLGALEEHCYKCLAMFCLTHAYKSSHWNHYSDFRTIILNSKYLAEKSNEQSVYREVLAMPSKSEFVHVSQKCSEVVSDVDLWFTANPPHQDFNADLYNLFMGEIVSSRKVFDNTDQMLQWNVFELLSSIKIFSFTQ